MSRRLRVIVPLILLVMMLMRIIWLNLRSYEPHVSPRAVAALNLVLEKNDGDCSDEDAGEMALVAPQPQNAVAPSQSLSPGVLLTLQSLCRDGSLTASHLLKWNQWFILITVFFCVLAVRFLTSSWTVALITGTVLLSRGGMLAGVELLGADVPIACLLAVWLCCIAHHLRTGSGLSAVAAGLTVLALALMEEAFIGLVLPVPLIILLLLVLRPILLRPLIQRLRLVRLRMLNLQGMRYETSLILRLSKAFQWLLGPAREESLERADPSFNAGLLFHTIDVPYALWLFRRGKWLKTLLLWSGLAALTLLSLATAEYFMVGWTNLGEGSGVQVPTAKAFSLTTWWQAVNTPLDYHLLASLFVIILSGLQYPADGLVSFQEAMWILLAALGCVAIAAFAFDVRMMLPNAPLQDSGTKYTLSQSAEWRRVAVWFEPVVLAAGVASMYNLIKVFDSRRQRGILAAHAVDPAKSKLG